MRRVLVLAAVGEAATGVALLIVPSLVGRLLFGEELTGVAMTGRARGRHRLGRAGRGMLPRRSGKQGLSGMLTYSLLATLYLVYLGIGGEWVGSLLWLAAAIHAALTFLLAASWFKTLTTMEGS